MLSSQARKSRKNKETKMAKKNSTLMATVARDIEGRWDNPGATTKVKTLNASGHLIQWLPSFVLQSLCLLLSYVSFLNS
jgi:hypothetical protein